MNKIYSKEKNMYLLRLDDASEYMNHKNWNRMKKILDQYGIKPIFGIIPNNMDSGLMIYNKSDCFWDKINEWIKQGWVPALHGYSHILQPGGGKMNPVNGKSEFVGLSLDKQKEKIRQGIKILHAHGINPFVFFAPAHTFDENTLKAIKEESQIRIISDTIAWDIYYQHGFYFIPQQSGKVRKTPFRITTFCYHPNNMTNKSFYELENFIRKNREKFGNFSDIKFSKRKYSLLDVLLKHMYFGMRLIRNPWRILCKEIVKIG